MLRGNKKCTTKYILSLVGENIPFLYEIKPVYYIIRSRMKYIDKSLQVGMLGFGPDIRQLEYPVWVTLKFGF